MVYGIKYLKIQQEIMKNVDKAERIGRILEEDTYEGGEK